MGNVIGNAIGSFFSGFGQVLAKLFGSQLDFLSGKACDSLCGSTWDLACYIENFCIAHLLKLAAVSFLFYIVMLFLYSFYKLGICQCICRSLCKMIWACAATFFSAYVCCCDFLCVNLFMVKRRRRRRRRDIEMSDMSSTSEDIEGEDSSSRYLNESCRNLGRNRRVRSSRLRDYKGDHLRRSLRPRSHRLGVKVDGDSFYATKGNHRRHGDRSGLVNDIRVTRTSKFARRGANYKKSGRRDRR